MLTIQRMTVGVAVTALLAFGAGTTTASALADPTKVGELTVIDTKYGEALADAEGNALYVFEKDGKNKSACTDPACVKAWPAALGDDRVSQPEDVTARLGSIDSAQSTSKGKQQLTVDDQPLYYFVKDTEPGDVNGQGVKSGGEGTTWWLVGTDGEPLPVDSGGGGYS